MTDPDFVFGFLTAYNAFMAHLATTPPSRCSTNPAWFLPETCIVNSWICNPLRVLFQTAAYTTSSDSQTSTRYIWFSVLYSWMATFAFAEHRLILIYSLSSSQRHSPQSSAPLAMVYPQPTHFSVSVFVACLLP
jgi:hypothetical protein